MSNQSDALRLADELDAYHTASHHKEAAAELRRLHQLALDQQGEIYALNMARSVEQKTAALKRDALLEALRSLLSYANVLEMRLADADGEHRAMQEARAAVRAAEGEKA